MKLTYRLLTYLGSVAVIFLRLGVWLILWMTWMLGYLCRTQDAGSCSVVPVWCALGVAVAIYSALCRDLT